MKTVVCSHGFGVDATGRGMFTDIAASFPDIKFVMFDYSIIDEAGNMTVRPIPEQVQLLNDQLAGAEGEIILLCHSKGCVVGALADVSKVSQVIFLAPPDKDSQTIEHFAATFGSREGAVFNPAGMSSIPRRDGTITYVSKEYLETQAPLDAPKLYADLAAKLPLTVICAADDEILAKATLKVPGAQNLALPANHDFSGPARQELINQLRELL